MLASFLMGLAGGQRAMTPLATVAIAQARGELSPDNGAAKILGHPIVAVGTLVLAAAELAGDKQKSAPDRIVPIGLVARFATSAIAGAALAPRRNRWLAAGIGGATAVAASYPGWRTRMAALSRYGQTRSGFVEDALVLFAAGAVVRLTQRPAGG